MKKGVNLLLIGALVLVSVIIAVVLLILFRDDVNDDPRDDFNYDLLEYVEVYSSGTMMPVSTSYELKKASGTWTATYIKDSHFWDDTESKTVSFKADGDFVDKVIDLLRENKASKWDGYDVDNKYITDGSVFRFKAVFSDGKTIEARGYMSEPVNYYSFESGFTELFEPYINSDGESK